MAGTSERRDPADETGGRPATGRSDRSAKWAVDRLDQRERRFSFVAAAGSVAFGVTVYLAETNAHYHLRKGQLSPQTLLVIGLVGGALLLGTTLLGRRAPVGFVAMFVGLFFSSSSLFLALPFLALAIWILYHSYKIQREVAADRRAARAESKPSGAGTTSRAPADKTKAGGARQKSGRGGATGPQGNKRYTPKRPPPPAPKPSRRERKAAGAAD